MMKIPFLNFALTLVVLSLIGCSTKNDKAPNIDPRTGKHPAGWVIAGSGGGHPAAFLAVPSSCYECHGKDLSGGIAKVSCFSASRNGVTCHAGGPSGHPAGWDAADVHGRAAKAAVGGQDGFSHCQLCHGADLTGGLAKVSCLNTAGCHGSGVFAAHPAKPWRDAGNTGASTHASTDASNADVCALCHRNGANSSRKPLPIAPAGTAPGCFNNTLCHGVEGHRTGWANYSAHGRAAKAAAGGITVNGIHSPISSFATCTLCHGNDYNGGTSQQTCLNSCHGPAAPHPPSPWRSSGGGVTHTDTDTSNAAQCALCHTAGAHSTRAPLAGDLVGTTGCFNNTLCHGVEGHPAGWNAAAQHGAAAKSAPGTRTGFSGCQPCHGSTFNNGSSTSCMNTLGCHGLTVSSPHPAKPWSSRTIGVSTHTDTDPGNAGTCAICHTGGANSTVVPPAPAKGIAGCFNNTLCHFHQIPFAPPTLPATVHGTLAKNDLRVCQNCHGVKNSTSFDGLALSGGIKTIACSSCHTFAKAHPTDWQGSGTYSHRTAGNTATACSLCHDVTQGRTAPLPAAPSCFSATFGNGLGQTRTCHSNGPGSAPHTVPYNNHNATARSNFSYCLGCHQVATNSSTASGKVIPRCLTCHLSDPTLTSIGCTSCHANPPAGSSYPDIAGNHGQHIAATKVASLALTCADCHTGLGLGSVDHQVRAKARTATGRANPVIFGSGILLTTGGGAASSFSDASGQCSNTYCHGAKMPGGDITGSNRNPVWGTSILPATLSAAACGTCHGFPPAAASGHPGGITIPAGFPGSAPIGTTCSCHGNINPAGNSYGNIFINKALHINGALEAPAGGAHAFPYGGSLHRPGGNGLLLANTSAPYNNCSGCHDTATAGGTYPVAAGTPPLCSGCHLSMNSFSGATPGCWDCHGSVNNAGRPSGATFPNTARRHSNPGVHAVACGVCHSGGGSGTATHGNSNRVAKARADVIIGFAITGTVANDSTMVISRSGSTVTCTGRCHISGGASRNHNDTW